MDRIIDLHASDICLFLVVMGAFYFLDAPPIFAQAVTPSITLTITPSPTNLPTPSISLTPSPSVKPSPSPSISPSPAPTASPSASVTPRPSPSDTPTPNDDSGGSTSSSNPTPTPTPLPHPSVPEVVPLTQNVKPIVKIAYNPKPSGITTFVLPENFYGSGKYANVFRVSLLVAAFIAMGSGLVLIDKSKIEFLQKIKYRRIFRKDKSLEFNNPQYEK